MTSVYLCAAHGGGRFKRLFRFDLTLALSRILMQGSAEKVSIGMRGSLRGFKYVLVDGQVLVKDFLCSSKSPRHRV